MKKRIISLLLVLVMLTTVFPVAEVYAKDKEETYSQWAEKDLKIGDTYGIYPQTWYQEKMKAAIPEWQLRVLIAGLRTKILNTDCVTKDNSDVYYLDTYLTVEEVLQLMHEVITSYEYTKDIGLKNYSAVNFMKEYGIYTGKEGKAGLSDTCTYEQACVYVTRLVTYLYDVTDAASKGFLWQVKSGEKTVYLLGSIHMATYDIYPFDMEMLRAYESADALAVEVDLSDTAGAMKLVQLGIYTDGTTLKDHISEETYQKTIKMAEKFGYTEKQLSLLKPWYIYIMFSALVNTDSGDTNEATEAAALGIDMHFMNDAVDSNKPILEIEGYEYQGKVLDSFSDELEEYLLGNAVDGVNEVLAGTYTEGVDDLELMLEFWSDGNAEEFLKYTAPEYEYPELYELQNEAEEIKLAKEFQEKLITQRDQGMAEYIDKLLKAGKEDTYFVVVGSGHFISEYSVIDRLKEMGYEVLFAY